MNEIIFGLSRTKVKEFKTVETIDTVDLYTNLFLFTLCFLLDIIFIVPEIILYFIFKTNLKKVKNNV